MKKIIALALCSIVVYGCAKKTNPVPTPSPSNPTGQPVPNPTNARFIPNWQRDTLVGQCVDINGQWVTDPVNGSFIKDTLVTYSVNDTSFIVHDGVRYYLWWKPMLNVDTFVNNSDFYANCAISKTPDTTGIVNKYNIGVSPGRYWDEFYNNWATQPQILMGHNFSTKYKIFNSYYQSIK